jgi:hypothetical protein
VKQFVAATKAASLPFKMGGTVSKREDQVLTIFLEQKTGAEFSYTPYKSGGESRPSSSATTPNPTSHPMRKPSRDAFHLSMIGSGGDLKVFWSNGLKAQFHLWPSCCCSGR